MWRNGKLFGKGTYTNPNGSKYVGEWRDNMKHGRGVYTWTDGENCEGDWREEKRHGQCRYTYANGKEYTDSGKTTNVRVKSLPWKI